MKIGIVNRINNVNIMGFQHKKSHKKNIDNNGSISYATDDNCLRQSNCDRFERSNDFGDIMSDYVPSKSVMKKIKDLCYEGISEPKYASTKSELDEYNCVNTINSYYDENNVLRKKTIVFNKDLLLNLCLYNELGFLTYEANVGFPASGPDVSIGRFHYDGTENENLVKTDPVSFDEN